MSNHPLLWGLAATGISQLFFCYLPAMNTLLGTRPIDAKAWGVIGLTSIFVIPVFMMISKKRQNP
jgi:quinol-cytochrome oxidoreductase complex cytochrome b subunit